MAASNSIIRAGVGTKFGRNGAAVALAAGATLLAGAAATTNAAVLYDSGGFEAARGFVALPPENNLEGQDPLEGPWFKVGTTSTAVVQTNAPRSGLQAVRVNHDGTDALWGVPAPAAAGSVGSVTIDFDMRVDSPAQPVPNSGPLFGIESYDSTSGVKQIAGLSMDATTGDVLYRQAGTGAWRSTGRVLGAGTYNRFTLSIDYSSKAYSVSVNGALLHTEGFVDSTAAAFSDAPIVARGLATGNVVETGTAYFDNYTINSAAAVPEPAALGAIAAATLVALRRRRAQR